MKQRVVAMEWRLEIYPRDDETCRVMYRGEYQWLLPDDIEKLKTDLQLALPPDVVEDVYNEITSEINSVVFSSLGWEFRFLPFKEVKEKECIKTLNDSLAWTINADISAMVEDGIFYCSQWEYTRLQEGGQLRPDIMYLVYN